MQTNHITVNEISGAMFPPFDCFSCLDTGEKEVFCYETGRDFIPCDDCGEVA